MYAEQFFDVLLDLGTRWRVERIHLDIFKEELNVYINYVGVGANDPETADYCPIYDHLPSKRWRHLNTLHAKTYLNCRVPRIKTDNNEIKAIAIPWTV